MLPNLIRSQSLSILMDSPLSCPLPSAPTPIAPTVSYLDPQLPPCLPVPILPPMAASGVSKMQNLPWIPLPLESDCPDPSMCPPRPLSSHETGPPSSAVCSQQHMCAFQPRISQAVPHPCTPTSDSPGLSELTGLCLMCPLPPPPWYSRRVGPWALVGMHCLHM